MNIVKVAIVLMCCIQALLSVAHQLCFFPKSNRDDVQISVKESYSMGFSTNHKQAVWIKYTLTSNQLCQTTKVERTDDFRIDKDVVNSSKPSDYTNSGFDKGHLCPAQDRSYNIEHMSETFLMSNMSPQEGSFNRGIWKKLEDFTRKYAIENGEIIVVTGPIILNRYQSIKNDVTIPHAYFKILFNTNRNTCLSFVIPNQKYNEELHKFQVPIDFIQVITGLKIIEDEQKTFK